MSHRSTSSGVTLLVAKRLFENLEEGARGRRFVGLMWNSEDMAQLYARLFENEPSAPAPDLPYGQMRVCFLQIMRGNGQVGWASGATYSSNLRGMISLGRINKELSAPGTEVSVSWGNFADELTVKIRAKVHERPFIKQHRQEVLSVG